MLRAGPSRLIRGVAGATLHTTRPTPIRATRGPQLASRLCTESLARPRPAPPILPGFRPDPIASRAHARAAFHASKGHGKDKEVDSPLAREKLQPTPETVSTTSTTTRVFEPVDDKKDPQMMASIMSDVQTIKETFSLSDVPRQAYFIGLAGVLPYLATSLSTVYCAWEINHATSTGFGYLMSAQSAELLLQILEPLQVGYGAVILSFLGAIHWGLEWAGYGGSQGYRRYAIGVFAPAVAWPTILLPVEYALITQFVAFTFLYRVDTKATSSGWCPPWYGIYRFVLTFIVGTSIVVSLIGRGEIAERMGRLPSPAQRIREFQEAGAQPLEEGEEGRTQALEKEE
ncbi:hypothetical protein BDY21DRAFT_280048 [Lineolata rhizophorae]|uniref:Transmembrane protein 69 n=1 Tax=Lineolata rhizophorae TaxID=578093 RepID=A0A6A6P9K1_9PEZI|nr:hypothetical protein BDY21DRAFT_280048 [Lineolata rhizophorae]